MAVGQHLGNDDATAIVAQVLTDGRADDVVQIGELLDAVDGDIANVVGDAAYDTVAVYDAARAREAEVVVPPTRTAVVSRRRPRSAARDRTIERVKEVGRLQWMKKSGYHQQGTVENGFFRYKTILGGSLRARHRNAQRAEARIACNVLNRMTQLGRLASCLIGA